MDMKDAAPKPTHDGAAIFGLANRAHLLIGKFLALPPNQRAQATDLVTEVASIVRELASLRSSDKNDGRLERPTDGALPHPLKHEDKSQK